MRFAELEQADVAIWGYGREGRSVLAALRRRFPDKPLVLYCGRDEVEAARVHGGADLHVIGVAPDAALDLRASGVLQSLGRAVIVHENGRCIYSDAQLAAAVQQALGLNPGATS